MQVTMIPYDHVERMWPSVEEHMEKAAKYTFGRYTAEDIKDLVLHYDHTLWAAFDEEGIVGAVVTNFTNYPRLRTLDMTFTGGTRLEEWRKPMLKLLQSWARDNNCDVIESTGRPGWAKIFKDDGHRVRFHTYELPVGEKDG